MTNSYYDDHYPEPMQSIEEIVNLFVDKVVVYEDKVEITVC